MSEKNDEYQKRAYTQRALKEGTEANISTRKITTGSVLTLRLPYYEAYQINVRLEKLAKEAGISKNAFIVQQIKIMLDVLDPQA